MSRRAGQPVGTTSLPREIWVLAVGNFIVAVGMGIITPALPIFATSFDVGVTAASLVISVVAMMRLAFAPLSSRLVTLVGERPVYLWGLVIVGAGTAACALASAYWQLVLFRAVSGIGATMYTVSAAVLMVRLAPPRLRGRAASLWGTSFLLGNISGPVVGGVVLEFSVRLPFLVYGGLLFVAAAVGWLRLRRPARGDDDRTENGPVLDVRTAFRHPTYRAALLSNFSFGWAVFGVRIALVPLFVIEALRSTQAVAGVVLSAFVAGNAVALMISGHLADRYGRKPMVLTGLSAAAVGTVAFGFGDSIPWLLVTSLIAGLGTGAFTPAQSAAVADIVGRNRGGGPVIAAFQMAADVGTIVGPLAAGVLVDAVSYRVAFTVTGLTLVLAMLLWTRAPETVTTDEEEGAR